MGGQLRVGECRTVEAALDDGPEATTGRSGVNVRGATHTGGLMVAHPAGVSSWAIGLGSTAERE
jgi:hypothetical protein